MSQTAVILETRHAGHAVGYATEVADAFAAAGFDVTLVLNGAARERPEVAEIVGARRGLRLDWTDPFATTYSSVEQGERELAELAVLAARYAPDRLAVPTADAIAQALPLSARAREIEAGLPRMDLVLHQIAAAYPPTGLGTWRRWRAGLAELRALARHRLLTPDAYVGIGPGGRAAWPSRAVPEFLPHLLVKQSPWDRDGARAHFGAGAEERVVVSTGDVAPRKGAGHLAAAIAHADWPERTTALFAGPVAAQMRPELDRLRAARPERFRVIDRFLGEDEFAAAFVAADAVWAVTPANLGVSSTFLYAARHRRPAIVARSHRSARWMCGRIGPGVATDLDPASVCAAVARALTAPAQTAKQAAFLSRMTDPAEYERIVVG